MDTITSASPHVFISYSRSNLVLMQRVSEMLREANIPVWTDERLTAGTSSWKNSIEHALQGAFCVVVLMSPTAKTSEWVERELDYAYVLQRPIYPLLVDGSQRDAVPFEIINMQYIDARTDFDQAVKQLIVLLSSYMVSPITSPEAVTPSAPQPSQIPLRQRVALEVAPSVTNPLSFIDILLYIFGNERENSEISLQDAARTRRIISWYFLNPRKFRLFSILTQDSTTRFVHAVVMVIAYLWLLGSTSLIWAFSGSQFSSIRSLYPLGFIIFIYSMVVLVPMTTAYKTRRAFFGSILYALLLLALVIVLVWIAVALMYGVSLALKVA